MGDKYPSEEYIGIRNRFSKLSEQARTDLYVTPRRTVYKYQIIDPSLRGAKN